MGFNLLKKIKYCCQGNSDNYFDRSSYRNESKVSAEDFFRKRNAEEVVDDSINSNVKFDSSILNNDKFSNIKPVDIDEFSILSDKNINQLRKRNPGLNKFNNDVIRLSLRKSLYANNLEQDLEEFIQEQQREANKYEKRENPYTISDMRELYDLINNLTIKELRGNSGNDIPSVNNEKSKTDFEKAFQNNEKVENKVNENFNSGIKNQSNITSDNNKYLKINTSIVNYIPKREKLSIDENKNIEEQEHEKKCNSTGSLYKDIICNEPKKMLNQSPEQSSFEVVNSSNNIKNNSNQITKSSILNYSEILFQSSKDKNIEQPHNILCNSPQQSYTDIIYDSPESSSNNILCSSPQQTFSDMVCESPVDEYDINNNDINHTLCESPIDTTKNVLCSSPQNNYSEMICESPVDESPKNETDISSMLYPSPKQKISNPMDQTTKSSPKTQSSKVIRKSTGYSFNSIEAFIGNISIQSKENTLISNHDKDHMYSQLKMTDLSKKHDNSLYMSSILGSSFEEKSKMNYYQTRPSQNSDSFQSIYSYDNMDNLSSRKITKRGLRILKSRDTLDKQRPVKIRTRRRKALLIGINYVNKPYELHGCINDARYIYSFLKENYDFKEENCRILTEDADDESLIPTKKNIINSMKWLVSGAKPGDSLFFHYSGHGLSFVDEDGDEIDGLDESILPVDYETNGVILDDEIHDLLVKPLPKGCLLTALADCCHSGTVLDLPYSYNSDGELECIDDMDRQHKEISKEYLSNEVYKKNKMVQNLINRNTSPPPIYLSLRERSTIDSYIKQTRKSSANVIQYSSCRDNEISADERANGNNYGALCNAFVSTLTNLILEEKTISYCELLKELTSIIQKRYGQTPQLTTGRPMDVHQPFEI